jgi:hypothetical protein
VSDVSDLHVADSDLFVERLEAALQKAVSWAEHEQIRLRIRRGQLWRECEQLAREPRLLDRLSRVLAALGVVGEERATKLVYLVVTARLFQRLVSAVLKGPSAAGKSYLVDSVLRFFPEQAYYCLTAMSERALAYSEEPLCHRVLVLYEAAGLQGDIANYLVRSLLSEGCIRYETTDKTAEGLRGRLIEREGPTSVIVTTTAISLHPESETRLLSIPVSDTPEQTKAILKSIAQADARGQVDLRPWHALQEFLASSECDVVIVFAEALAELIPAVAVRLRRDFTILLILIRAHALLHQATRDRTPEGAIIATIADDYAVVRDLISDLISEGVDSTVSAAVRETVETVAQLIAQGHESVSQADIGRALKLDKSAVSRRVKHAIAAGYLRNTEEGKPGKKAKLVLGEPLPEELELLPSPARLAAECCTVAPASEEEPHPPPPDRDVVARSDESAVLADLGRTDTGRDTGAACPYPHHRFSDWETPDGRTVCGVCHPPTSAPPDPHRAREG